MQLKENRNQLNAGSDENINQNELIQELKAKIEDSKINTSVDENYLLQFLSTRKFNVNKAFILVRNFAEYKTENADQMDINQSLIRDVLQSQILNILSKRDAKNRRIFWLRLGKWNPSKLSLDTVLQVGILLAEAAIWHAIEISQPSSGVIVIFDLKNVTLSQIRQITPSFARRYVNFTTNCLPFKLLAAHFVNANLTFSILVSIFKRFMNEKSKKRIQFHGNNLQSLHTIISKDILPKDLGGLVDENSAEIWMNIIGRDFVKTELAKSGFNIQEDLN